MECLRHCLPPSVRRTLNELPETLDDTYERILKEIKKSNRGHARRVLQCLVVAIRPLRVAELAEVLAVDFDDAEGIPKLNADWRWEDQEQALLIACSGLISIVQTRHSRVVQFSHSSVREFLTSSRLATATGEVSDYHIDLAPAHTTLAQACLGVLLQTQHDVDGHTPEDHPLSGYAARHWTTHTQFECVSSRLQEGMKNLFDRDKSHFRVWRALYDIDTGPASGVFFYSFQYLRKSAGSPLYYAALCGFHDLAKYLIIKYPQDVNATGGHYLRPLFAALAGKHFQTADLLCHNGATPNFRDTKMTTPLHSAAGHGELEIVQKLIEYDGIIGAKDLEGRTQFAHASGRFFLKSPTVFRSLLKRVANINARDEDGCTPLHYASSDRSLAVARLLLERGANIDARANDGSTPLHRASSRGYLEVVRLLLDHGANINAQVEDGRTPLHKASSSRHLEVVRLLLERGANIHARAKDGSTPLHRASSRGYLEVVRLLLERGANINARDEDGWTPLHYASSNRSLTVVRLLLDRGANTDARANDGSTPLHSASFCEHLEAVRQLLERGAKIKARSKRGWTPLHYASYRGCLEVVPLLLERGANVNAQGEDGRTPLHEASSRGFLGAVRLLLERGADVHVKDKRGKTVLHAAKTSCSQRKDEIIKCLREYEAK